MATYTTTDAIARRLRGRLTTGAATAFGVSQIEADLLTQVLDQTEAYIDARLATRYTLPITSSRLLTILAEITELLVICRVMPIHYANTEESEDGGYGAIACKQGEAMLAKLLDGQLETDQPIESTAPLPNYSGSRRRTSGKSAQINWGNPRL